MNYKNKVKTEAQPILVKNPNTGRYINFQPIFEMIDTVGDGKTHLVADEIDRAIRYVALSDGSDVIIDKTLVLWTLYELRDAFSNASEN